MIGTFLLLADSCLELCKSPLKYRDPRLYFGKALCLALGPQNGFPMLEVVQARMNARNSLRRSERGLSGGRRRRRGRCDHDGEEDAECQERYPVAHKNLLFDPSVHAKATPMSEIYSIGIPRVNRNFVTKCTNKFSPRYCAGLSLLKVAESMGASANERTRYQTR